MSARHPIDVDCPHGERWSEMTREEGGRRCGRCDRHLVDLSRLTRPQAERFLDGVRGRVCARVATDREGRPIYAKRAVRRLVSTAAGVMLSVSVAACGPEASEPPAPDPAAEALARERAETARLREELREAQEASNRAEVEARRIAEEVRREQEEAEEEPEPEPVEQRVGRVRPRNR